MVDVLGSQDRRKKVYCQIVMGMATFDLVTAIPWLVSSSAIPRYVDGGDESGVLGAHGSDFSCRLQGFLISLGIGWS